MKYYMHTINDQPGFYDGYQICYSVWYGAARHNNILVESLKQIKEERISTIKNRKKDDFVNAAKYDYIVVYTP